MNGPTVSYRCEYGEPPHGWVDVDQQPSRVAHRWGEREIEESLTVCVEHAHTLNEQGWQISRD